METEEPANRNLLEFQKSRSSSAFLCRYPKCPRAAQGFSNSEIRQTHEESHRPRFQCTHASCGFFGITFHTRAAMKKHATQYHDEEDTASVPSSLIRKPRGAHEDRSLFTFTKAKRKRRASGQEEVQIANDVTFSNKTTSMASPVSRDGAFERSGKVTPTPPTPPASARDPSQAAQKSAAQQQKQQQQMQQTSELHILFHHTIVCL